MQKQILKIPRQRDSFAEEDDYSLNQERISIATYNYIQLIYFNAEAGWLESTILEQSCNTDSLLAAWKLSVFSAANVSRQYIPLVSHVLARDSVTYSSL